MKPYSNVTKNLYGLFAMGFISACHTSIEPTDFPSLTDPAGCVIEQITTAQFDEYQVQGVSDDGRLLSYSWNKGEDENGNPLRGVYTLDLLTGEQSTPPESINNSGNFSADGRFLVVAAYDSSGRTEILELDRDTGGVETIASHEHWDWLPSYSTDGKYIVFNSYRNGGQSDIFIYERATGALERITDFDGYDAHAQFSSDDRRIVFHRMNSQRENGGYDFDLWVYDRDSKAETRLTDGAYEESYAAFAPNGQHLVFSSDFEENPEKHNLYIWSPNGGPLTKLTDGDWKDSYAYWTTDGAYIYFNSDRTGVGNIFRIPMDGLNCLKK